MQTHKVRSGPPRRCRRCHVLFWGGGTGECPPVCPLPVSEDPRTIKDHIGKVTSGSFVAGGVIYLFIYSRNNVRVSN